MAYKRKATTSNSKRSTKRTYRGKGRRIVPRRTIARLPSSFPKKMITKMKYATTVRIDPDNLAPVAVHFFSCNNLYDPDTTGIGHQPYTHDQFAATYNHYRVLKSRIVATFLGNGASSTGHFVGGIMVTPDTTTLVLDYDSIRERNAGRYKVSGANGGKITVSQGYNGRKMYPTNVANLNAAFGASPNEQAYYAVYATACNETLNISSIDVVITIEYTVLMWELKNLGES